MSSVSVLCASGSMGLTPFHEESFWDGVKRRPDAIVADAGSGDIGPYYLGSDHAYNPRSWEKHDLREMLLAARQLNVPMIVGSAGGAGTNRAVNLYAEIIEEIAREEKLAPFKMTLIYSELEPAFVKKRLSAGPIKGLGFSGDLTEADLDRTDRVVAMMGLDPLLKALDEGADVIIAGRSCDDAIFAVVPVWKGYDRGLSLHMGKCIECGPLVATPILQREAVMGIVRDGDFLVEPMHPGQRCTVASVTGHTLYERVNPYFQPGPGGVLDLRECAFEPFTDRVVKVTGSRFVPEQPYRVKLEGSGFVGHRALVIFGLRDPNSVRNVDNILEAIRAEARRIYPKEVQGETYHVMFHVYGRDAIMKSLEPIKEVLTHELGIVVEVVSSKRDLAYEVAKLAKYTALRAHYPGKLGTAGGAALMADEVIVPQLQQYQWTVDHLLTLDDPCEIFPSKSVTVNGR